MSYSCFYRMPLLATLFFTVSFQLFGSDENQLDALNIGDAEPKPSMYASFGGKGETAFSYNVSRLDDSSSQTATAFSLPMAAIWGEFGFGKGWKAMVEVQFESGSIGADGGHSLDLSLENLWVEKTFNSAANIRAGLMQVPVGGIIHASLPTDFFGVYMPVGESTLLPDTWLETGVSFWGEASDWRYEAMIMPGLDSSLFTADEWIHNGALCPMDYKTISSLAGAFRVDNMSVPDLRMGLSGYWGGCFNSQSQTVGGNVGIGSFDFDYRPLGADMIARGGVTFGHIAGVETEASTNLFTAGVEVGYDLLGLWKRCDNRLYLYGRYDYVALESLNLNRVAVGLNYFPLDEVVIKAEYSYEHQSYDVSTFSLGVGFAFQSADLAIRR